MSVMTPGKIFIYFSNMLRMCRTKRKFRKKLKPYGLGQKYIQKKDYCQEKI